MPLGKTIVSSFFFFSSLVFGFHEALCPSESESHSVVSNSLWPHGLYSPWNSPGQNIGVGSHSLLQGFFPTQGLNPGFPHYRQILYQLSHQGSPKRVVKRERIIQEELMVIWDTVGVMPGLLRWLSGICLQWRSRRRRWFDPWVWEIPGEGHGNPCQYSYWRIPRTEEPCRLQPIGLQSWTRLKQLSIHACRSHA